MDKPLNEMSKEQLVYELILAFDEINILKDALFQISTAPQPYNEFEYISFVDTAKRIASEALPITNQNK